MSIKIDGKEVVRMTDNQREVVRIVQDGTELWSGLSSCFASGYWIDKKPWTDKKGWKD